MLWAIIVGGFIGLIAGGITKKGGSMGIIANIFAGLVGSSVGQSLFGAWGTSLAGMALIPSILGAVIVVAVVSFFLGKKEWTWIFLTGIDHSSNSVDERIQYVKNQKNTLPYFMYFNLDNFDSYFARLS